MALLFAAPVRLVANPRRRDRSAGVQWSNGACRCVDGWLARPAEQFEAAALIALGEPTTVNLVAAWLVEVQLPVVRHLACRSGSRLAERVVPGRGERRALTHLVRPIVVVPVLAGFEARDDPMTRAPGVSTRMLGGRGIATPDVAALGAAPQMKPPSTGGKALDTAITAGRHARVDQ